MSAQERTPFEATHYAATSRGWMPGRVIEDLGHLLELEAPNGRSYTFGVDSVLTAAEAQVMFQENRMRTVRETYRFKLVARGTVRATGENFSIITCEHPTDKKRRYTIHAGVIETRCSCQAFLKAGECKHSLSVPANLRSATVCCIPTAAELQAERDNALAYADPDAGYGLTSRELDEARERLFWDGTAEGW
jgi:hypothetical protein